jgi:molybdopterin-guanine dinucleotide biosynthesis protein A
VREDPPGGGPVAALAAGLPVGSAPVVVVLAADLPFVTAAHLRALAAAVDGCLAAVAVDDDGRDQPLLAAYRRDALVTAMPAAPAGAPLRAVVGAFDPVVRVRLVGSPPPWFDCDDEAALAKARDPTG